MSHDFPPLPPEYVRVLAARWLCLASTLLALGWLLSKCLCPKTIRATDAGWWFGILVMGAVLSATGTGFYTSNDWLLPLTNMAIGVPLAGLLLTLISRNREARFWDVTWSIGLSVICVTLCQPVPVAQSREASRRTQCKNNLQQIGIAFSNYLETYGTDLPPSAAGTPPVSWRVLLLPVLGEQMRADVEMPGHPTRQTFHPSLDDKRYREQLARSGYDLQVAWDALPNAQLAQRDLFSGLYRCPSNPYPQDAQGRWFTAYSMLTGPRTLSSIQVGSQFRNVTDGLSNTLLVVEACGAQIVWTEPRDVDIGLPPGINLKGGRLGYSEGWLSSHHRGGTQVLLADGSVRFISEHLDPKVLRKLATIDDGEDMRDF